MRQIIVFLSTITLLACGNKRTQEPNGPLPHESKEVNFKSLNGLCPAL